MTTNEPPNVGLPIEPSAEEWAALEQATGDAEDQIMEANAKFFCGYARHQLADEDVALICEGR